MWCGSWVHKTKVMSRAICKVIYFFTSQKCLKTFKILALICFLHFVPSLFFFLPIVAASSTVGFHNHTADSKMKPQFLGFLFGISHCSSLFARKKNSNLNDGIHPKIQNNTFHKQLSLFVLLCADFYVSAEE